MDVPNSLLSNLSDYQLVATCCGYIERQGACLSAVHLLALDKNLKGHKHRCDQVPLQTLSKAEQ